MRSLRSCVPSQGWLLWYQFQLLIDYQFTQAVVGGKNGNPEKFMHVVGFSGEVGF
uniref:Uncharacterized protein n=1 Tax=Rhizophora mucronata TaxID=61149 RepID=A0A2P2J1Z5_RHIMU